jgi:hypothetical protein
MADALPDVTAALRLVRLEVLMKRTSGSPDIGVGLIDGPVAIDHPDLDAARIRPVGASPSACGRLTDRACGHGTFVAGILAARRGSQAPAICPGCTLLVRPIFGDAATDDVLPSARPQDVAEAIGQCLDAGARIVNLSAAISVPALRPEPTLRLALDDAVRRGAIIVAAAGNHAMVSSSPITRHPGVIPVVAYGLDGRPLAGSNFSRSAAQRGLGAPGEGVLSLAASGAPGPRVGTSFAAPFVAGALALLWSLFPKLDAGALRFVLSHGLRRASVVAPLMDAEAAYGALTLLRTGAALRVLDPSALTGVGLRAMPDTDTPPAATSGLDGQVAEPAESAPAAPGVAVVAAPVVPPAPLLAAAPSYVYALGQIEPRYPSLSIEKEFAQVIGRRDTGGLTDRQSLKGALSERENRYLARSLCWVFVVEGLDTYILVPQDSGDYDLLVEAYRDEARRDDLDVVIGVRSHIAPPDMCNGLALPVVVFDQLYSFERDELIEAIPKPDSVADKDVGKFRSTAGGLFDQLSQMADNAGASDEHRALNYLTVRYPRIYGATVEQYDRNFAFTRVDVVPSRLSGTRTIVDVVFSYTHRENDVVEKQFVRVDVTELFPFLVTKMSPYYDR